METRAKPTDDMKCPTGDEVSRQACSRSSYTQAQEFYFKIHSTTAYLSESHRARTQLERSYLELTRGSLTGAVTEPRKLSLEEFTRVFKQPLKNHSETIYFEDFHQAITPHCRSRIEDTRRSLSNTEHDHEKLPYEESTRAFSLGFEFHQETSYFKDKGREKSALVRVGLGAKYLILLLGYLLPKWDLSLYGSLENHVWRPGLHHHVRLKTIKTLRGTVLFFPSPSFIPLGFPGGVLTRQQPLSAPCKGLGRFYLLIFVDQLVLRPYKKDHKDSASPSKLEDLGETPNLAAKFYIYYFRTCFGKLAFILFSFIIFELQLYKASSPSL